MKFVFHIGVDDIFLFICIGGLVICLIILALAGLLYKIQTAWRNMRAKKKGERIKRRRSGRH